MQTALKIDDRSAELRPLSPFKPPLERTDERRSSDRTRTLYRIARLSTEADSGLCRVQNMSDTGMMLFTSMELRVGEYLTLTLSDSISLSAEVVWTEAVRIGVRFREAIDSAALLKSLAAERMSGRQRSPRLPVNMIGVATTERGVQSIRVLDVSQHGMKVAHDGSLRADTAARIALENGLTRRAVVRWSENSTAGLQLLEPIPHHQLASACML